MVWFKLIYLKIKNLQDIWSSNIPTNNIWSTRTCESPLGNTTSLFDLTSKAKYAAGGWSPNDSAPFGSQSPVQQIRRHSATPASPLAESPFTVTTPPPEDSSIVAWGPAITVIEPKTDVNRTFFGRIFRLLNILSFHFLDEYLFYG